MGDDIYSFIPMNVLMSNIMGIMHTVTIPQKVRLSAHLTSTLARSTEVYPMLGRQALTVSSKQNEVSIIRLRHYS